MKKVLVIGYVWPEPSSSAAGYHMLSVLRVYRKQGWQVEFVTPAQPTEHMVDLEPEGITSREVELNSDSFDEYINEYQPDIVHFDRFMMEEQFGWRVDQHCPNALKVLDTVDLHFLREARHDAYKANREANKQDLSTELAKREIAAILRCDVSLIISVHEMRLLIEVFDISEHILHHLPFMVDLDTLPAKTLGFDDRQHFMTIGNFRHAPNWDAVLYLQSIWPLIRKQLPETELHIYGSYQPPKAAALNNPKAGFLIKGRAECSSEIMESARVCLAPLRFGAGLKGKLLDAMVMQTPSVTTSVGAEGMQAPDTEWPGVVADDCEEYADEAVKLYREKQRWEAAQTHARQQLQHQFDGEILAKNFIEKIIETQRKLDQHRLDNFTGAMLKHHTMTSTKYLSRWIVEKNKT